jgi:hypothetical protein
MAEDRFAIAWWAENLATLDREIARLASLCQVKILDPGVVARVLHKDTSVCGTENPRAFARLHDLVMVHLALREKSAGALGSRQTLAIEDHIAERLAESFPNLGKWPPA